MPSGVAARRYAQAVFELANNEGALEVWDRDLARLAAAFDDPQAAAFFESPQVPNERKRDAAAQLLGPESSPLVRNLIGLLIERRRFRQLPQLYTAFHERLLEQQGIAVGEVTTAVPLSDEELQVVRERLRALLGKEIEVRAVVDPEIIGGIVARVGDQLIDGSVIGQLRKLRERLLTAER